ncbi:hypothetical protein F4810DRAFT_554932 [Camillea tinctor]|nr:hypothetical protein F4810DRAFT_554932 [Camillea tinctor]
MPPKRAAPGRAVSSTRNKRARSSTSTSASTSASASAPASSSTSNTISSDEPPRSTRWASVSGSANADADYKTTWKNPAKSYSYITICPPVMGYEDEDDEDEEDDSEDDDDDDDDDDDGDSVKEEEAPRPDDGRDGPKCGKKDCMCFKPASEHPDYPWVVSRAGYRKFFTQHIHAQLRDPDNFDMYTFNDHAGYGILEVVQNLFLDFEEAAARSWKEQWAVCEATALWLLHPASGMLMNIDDGEGVNATMRLVGRMFLHMLALLDDQGLVGDATEVRSLGCVMAMYMKLAVSVRDMGVLDSDLIVRQGGARKALQPDHFEEAILTYANKRGVTLQGPPDIDELAAGLDGDLQLPARGAADPWGWKSELRRYTRSHGVSKGNGASRIGGDKYDITTWTSAERKRKSYSRRDPLGRREIDAIRRGLVLQLG